MVKEERTLNNHLKNKIQNYLYNKKLRYTSEVFIIKKSKASTHIIFVNLHIP